MVWPDENPRMLMGRDDVLLLYLMVAPLYCILWQMGWRDAALISYLCRRDQCWRDVVALISVVFFGECTVVSSVGRDLRNSEMMTSESPNLQSEGTRQITVFTKFYNKSENMSVRKD